jgi:hypothetical protein
VTVKVACQCLKRKGLTPEDHFYGIDAINFFRDTAAAIGGVNEEDFHLIFA